jgi:hypothetical protein
MERARRRQRRSERRDCSLGGRDVSDRILNQLLSCDMELVRRVERGIE